MHFEATARRLFARNAGIRSWAVALLEYAIKRFFRVYPLFAFVAILVWVLPNSARSRFYTLPRPEEYDLFKVLTFEEHSRYFVFWTLPLEITYYLLIPILVVVTVLLGRFSWIVIAPTYWWVFKEGWTVDRRPFMMLETHLSTFVAGSLAAIMFSAADRLIARTKYELRDPKHVAVIRGTQFATFVLTMSLIFHGLAFHWFIANPFEQHDGASPFISVPVSLLIVLEIFFPTVLSSMLEWPLLCYAGKISFSMYLLHPFVIKHEWIESGQKTWHDQFFAWVILVFLVSTVSYRLIEYPAQVAAQRLCTRVRAWESQLPVDSKVTTELPLVSMAHRMREGKGGHKVV